MRSAVQHLSRFLRQEEGATAVEYAVMLALILITIIATIGTVGGEAGGMWGEIRCRLVGHGF